MAFIGKDDSINLTRNFHKVTGDACGYFVEKVRIIIHLRFRIN